MFQYLNPLYYIYGDYNKYEMKIVSYENDFFVNTFSLIEFINNEITIHNISNENIYIFCYKLTLVTILNNLKTEINGNLEGSKISGEIILDHLSKMQLFSDIIRKNNMKKINRNNDTIYSFCFLDKLGDLALIRNTKLKRGKDLVITDEDLENPLLFDYVLKLNSKNKETTNNIARINSMNNKYKFLILTKEEDYFYDDFKEFNEKIEELKKKDSKYFTQINYIF